MSSVANASVEVIEKFKGENSEFSSSLSALKSYVYDAINELKTECDYKAKAYSSMAQEAEALAAKARQKQAQAQAQASAAAANAASTPKTIKVTKTDSEGNEVTVTKPNPAYAAAQSAANNAKAHAAAAGNAVANAIKVCEQIKARAAQVEQMSRTIYRLDGEIIPQIDKATTLVQSADSSVQQALNAIREYVAYRLKG